MFRDEDGVPMDEGQGGKRPDDEQQKGDGGGKFIGFAIAAILGIVLLPALIIGLVYHVVLFRKLKYKMSFQSAIAGLLLLIFGIFILIFDPIAHLVNSFEYITVDFVQFLTMNIINLVLIWFPLGIIFGYLTNAYHALSLKKSPQLRSMPGWSLDYEYAKSPWEKLKRKTLIKSIKSGDQNSKKKAPIGVLDGYIKHPDMDLKGKGLEWPESIIGRYYTEADKHTLITGGTGSGKTITSLALIKNDIEHGIPICFIDFKKSMGNVEKLSKWAKKYGRPFYHFTSGYPGEYKNPYSPEQASYDPLASGSPTSKADLVLNMRTWDAASEVYKTRTQGILNSLFLLLDVTTPADVPGITWNKGGLAKFASALQVDNLKDMIESYGNKRERGEIQKTAAESEVFQAFKELYALLDGRVEKDIKNQLNELLNICRILIMSTYNNWLVKGQTSKHIDLLELVFDEKKEGPVIIFSFHSAEEPEFAKAMGSIVMSDLGRVSAIKEAKGNESLFGLYADEFQLLNPNSVKDLLEKARSAQIFVTLTCQSLEQIKIAATKDGDATVKAILDTCANFLFHNGATQETAEIMSGLIGKYDKVQYNVANKMSSKMFAFNLSRAKEAMTNRKTTEEWIIPPQDFIQLEAPSNSKDLFGNPKAQAYFITKQPADTRFKKYKGYLARKIQIVAPDDVIKKTSKKFQDYYNSGKGQAVMQSTPEPVIPVMASDYPEPEYSQTSYSQEDIAPPEIKFNPNTKFDNSGNIHDQALSPDNSLLEKEISISYDEDIPPPNIVLPDPTKTTKRKLKRK